MMLRIYPPTPVSVQVPPVSFTENGIITEVTESKGLPSQLMIYKDGVQYPVAKDTADPSGTLAVPVEIVGVDGTTINITAGDINVQLTDQGANADVVRIGDGTNQLSIDANGKIGVEDSGTITELQSVVTELEALNTTDFATETTLTALAGTDFATETTLQSIDGKDFATETTLGDVKTATELIAETVGDDGNPASTKGLAIGGVDGNGDFQQVSVNAAGEMLVNISTGAGGLASEATLNEMNDKFNAGYGSATTGVRTASQIGNATGAADFNAGSDSAQTLRVSANLKRAGNELSYNSGPADANTLRTVLATGHGLATSAKQDDLLAKFGNIGQQASAGSAPAVLSTEQEAILQDIVTKLDDLLSASRTIDSLVNITTTDASISAPADAKGFIIQNSTNSNGGLRFGLESGTVDASNGFYLGVGQSTSYVEGAANLQIYDVDGAGIDACIIWFK